MLPFFKLGVGGPVAGGRQYLRGSTSATSSASTSQRSTAPPGSGAGQRDRAGARHEQDVLPRARPGAAPPGGRAGARLAVRVLYGEMAEIVVQGQRAVPERPLALGYRFRHPELDAALRDALAG